MSVSERSIAVVSGVVLLALVAWRLAWLSAGVADVTSQADGVRAIAMNQSESFRISFASETKDSRGPLRCELVGAEVWAPNAAVWITPGADEQPGWATWDDNGNGTVDDPGELGAAWSDDFCVVENDSSSSQPTGRIIDRGAYRDSATGPRKLFRAQP